VPLQQPANASDVAKVVEERLGAVSEEPGLQESVTIEWRGKSLTIPVVAMPVQLLSYNPATHRIRAQRTLDPARNELLDKDPFGTAGQDYLHHLLRVDPADPDKIDPTFEALKEDLGKHGQTEPGIITRAGVLVNGNTRCAALKDLHADDIRVGVLPSDTSHADVDAVELALQLRREYKRDYSFVNALLAIDERKTAGWTPDRITKEFRIAKKTLDRSEWILAFIEEAIGRSKVELPNGGEISMRLVDFETHQGKLEELYRTYTGLKSKDPDGADALREARLIAIALGKSKTDARLIESDFGEQYLSKLDGDASPQARTAVIPGTTIEAPAPALKVAKVRAIADRVLKATAVAHATKEVAPDAVKGAHETLALVDGAVELGLNREERSHRLKRVKFAAADRLSDANDAVAQALDAVSQARAASSFEPEDFDEPLRELRQNLRKLARLATAADGPLPEGLEWLRAVARIPDTPGP
jgi:hypothetical protein